MARKPTLRDIAWESGVSAMTVSLALRGSRRIRVETVARVRAAADKLGYQSHPLISAAMSQLGRTRRASFRGTIAYLISGSSVSGDGHPGLFPAALTRARELGFQLEAVNFHLMPARRLEQILSSRGIDGIVVAPLVAGVGHIHIDWGQFSCAAIGYSLPFPLLHRAAPDYFTVMALALREIRRKGYRRIGLAISATDDARRGSRWSAAYLSYREHIPARQRIPPFMPPEFSKRSFLRWFHRNRPDAIVGMQFSNIRKTLEKEGLHIPADVGFAHLNLEEAWAAGICAGVSFNMAEVARAGVDLVVDGIVRGERGAPALAKQVLIAPTWKDGPSVPPRPGSR